MSDPKERLIRIMGTFDLATGHADTLDELLDSLESELRDVLGHYRAAREWVGLTDDEIETLMDNYDVGDSDYARAIEQLLKEKNT
jgi:ribosome assembly protein YihI (activator of Der GTPase)